MKNSENIVLGVTLSMGLVVVIGAATGAYLLLRRAPPAPAVGGSAGSTLAVGNGVLASVGSGGTAGWSVQQALAQQQATEAQWRRADAINGLNAQLAACLNEIKRQTDQLNVIDGTPMPADIITRWSQQHQTDCVNSRPVISKWTCHATDLSDGYQAKADADWSAQKTNLKRPILVRLSELNDQQHQLINNLAALGVTRQPVSVRSQ